MTRHLNLVESDFEKMEKRILPRFPFCYLTFKESVDNQNVYEVKDISKTGMQLCLKNGEHKYSDNVDIGGNLSWLGNNLDIQGSIKWINENRLGVEFINAKNHKDNIEDFLKLDNFIKALKPIHLVEYGTALPRDLHYWLRSDGPVELFVWVHSDGEHSKFQFLVMEHFIEWTDGEGLKTGRVISKRSVDTPLVDNDEFVFKIDNHIDDEKIELARALCKDLDSSKIPVETINFLKLKLGI